MNTQREGLAHCLQPFGSTITQQHYSDDDDETAPS